MGSTIELHTASTVPLTMKHLFDGGDPGPIAAALAHVPELAEVALPFIRRALSGTTLSPRQAELVILRTSASLRCRYCTITHAALALEAEVDAREVRALCADARPAMVDPREAALLAWVDEAAVGPGGISAAATDGLAEHWAEHEIVEVAAMLGCTVMLNRFCTALALPASAESADRLIAAGIDPEALCRERIPSAAAEEEARL